MMIYEVVDGKYDYYRPDRNIIKGMGFNVRSGHSMFIYIEKEHEDLVWEHRSKENTFVKIKESEEFREWLSVENNFLVVLS